LGDEEVVVGNTKLRVFFAYIHNTDPTSNSGHPCISVPIGKTKSKCSPVGLEFISKEGNDEQLLHVIKLISQLCS